MSPSILFSVGAKQLSKLSPPSHSCLCLSSISCSPSLILYRLYTSLYTSTSHTSATHFTALTGGVFKRTSALFTADASTCPRFAFQSTSLGKTRSPLLRGRIHLRSKTSSESNIRPCFQSPIVQQQKPKLKARSGHCYRSHNALLHWSLFRPISPGCCSERSIRPGHPFKPAKETTWVQSIVWVTTSVRILRFKQPCQKITRSLSFFTW